MRVAGYTLLFTTSLTALASLQNLAAADVKLSKLGREVRVVDTPPATPRKPLYQSNRPPLYGKLCKLPTGSIRPEGWLRNQLELMVHGLAGRLPEVSTYCRFQGSAWASPTGEGRAWWEELPCWLRGFTALAYVLKDQRLEADARRWIDAVLSSQREDGYFGPRINLAANYAEARYLDHPSPDLWPNMMMLYALRTYYEATGDARVLRFMSNYFRWQSNLPLPEFLAGRWSQWRGGENLESIYWLYDRTGESWLLELARVNHERTQDWISCIPRWHGVGLALGFREPAQFFRLAQDVRYLDAARRNYLEIYNSYGQVPGGLYGADEFARPGFTGPRQGTETCSMVEMMHSLELMVRLTGESVWADRCENIAFNSLPAALSADMKAVHYLTAPNQVQLDRQNKSPLIRNSGEQFSYSPFGYRCCLHNHGFGWSYFADNLWMATETGGLAATLYAASRVTAKVANGESAIITETTDYPFGDTVDLSVSLSAPAAFPLLLRIPDWCESPRIMVNGNPLSLPAQARGWILLERTWNEGDRVQLKLPAKVRLAEWQSNRHCVSVSRGALTFSLRIGERWQRYGGTDEWPAYEVYSSTPWNYGLLLSSLARPDSYRVVRKKLTGQPFRPEDVPLEIVTRAKRIDAWKMEANGIVGRVPVSPVASDASAEEVTLIPMGAARLRISAFPTVSDDSSVKPWKEDQPLGVASTCWPQDTPLALSDGIVPRSSDDETVPRFSWWDRTGSREWVEYHFPAPRRISRSDVYWADDSAGSDATAGSDSDAGSLTDANPVPFWVKAGGGLRPPISWKLLWWDGRGWKAVDNKSAYGVEKDKFNRVEFKPVVTRVVRLQVELKPQYSGGILEWDVSGN